MHVVSVCFHYENIIDKSKNKVQIHHLRLKCFHTVKDCENRSSVSVDIWLNTPVFGRVIPDVHKWARSTLELLDQITRNFYRGIICAVNAHTVVAIFHFVSECQSDERGEFVIFSQNWLPWQRPFWYRKKRSRSIICIQNDFIQWKDCENRSIDPEIICQQEIIKKGEKRKKLTQAKYIAQSATLSSGLK